MTQKNQPNLINQLVAFLKRYPSWAFSIGLHVVFLLLLLSSFNHSQERLSINVIAMKQPQVVQAQIVSLASITPPKPKVIIKPEQKPKKVYHKPKPKKIRKPTPKPVKHKPVKPKKVVKKTVKPKKIDKQKAIERLRKLAQSSIDQTTARAVEGQRAKTEVDKYRALIQQVVRSHWINQTDNPSLQVTLLIRMDIKGNVLSADITSSSGNSAFDRQVVMAVQKSSPLPLPKDTALAEKFRVIRMQFSNGG